MTMGGATVNMTLNHDSDQPSNAVCKIENSCQLLPLLLAERPFLTWPENDEMHE